MNDQPQQAAAPLPVLQTAPASETMLGRSSNTRAAVGGGVGRPAGPSRAADAVGLIHAIGPVGGTLLLIAIVALFGVGVAGVVALGGIRRRVH